MASRAALLLGKLVSAVVVALLSGGPGLLTQLRGCSAKTLERDVYALIALYQEVSERDPYWKGSVGSWPVHTCSVNGTCAVDPCGFEWEGNGWEGVTCRYQWNWDTAAPRVVTNWHLPKRGLTGPIPKALSLFANITELDMDSNVLTGTLPPEWGCLSNLIEIDLSNNKLQGTIPSEWGVLRGLVEMELDQNSDLTGCVPRGVPNFEQLCGTRFGPPCPGFTKDPMIGTSVTATRIRTGSWCSGGAPSSLDIRCPVVADYEDSITQFFTEQQKFDASEEAQEAAKASAIKTEHYDAFDVNKSPAAAAAAPAGSRTQAVLRLPFFGSASSQRK